MYLSDLLSSPEYKSSNMIVFLRQSYCGLNKENSDPVRFSPLTDQQK